MLAALPVESTLTDRYQTTVPETVRRALRLGHRDKIHCTIRPGGEVVLTHAAAGDGPAPMPFLRFQALVGAVELDLDAPRSLPLPSRSDR